MMPTSNRITGRFFLPVIILTVVFSTTLSAKSMAEHHTGEQVQNAVKDSLKVLWTGEKFSPEQENRQAILINMLDTGVIKKDEVLSMIAKSALPVLNNYKTTRYILGKAPVRAKDLFGSYLNWKEITDIAWKAISSVVKDEDQITIPIGALAPPGTPWLHVPETMLITRLAELSNNKVIIKVYGGGVMGEDVDLLRKMDIGQLDGCGATVMGFLAAAPETSAFMMPGMYQNYDEIDYIYRTFRKRINAAFEKRGYVLAAVMDTGFFYLFSKYRFKDLEDIKKQKVLTCFGVIETTLYSELEIDATPVAVPEVVSALSTGMVNTVTAPAAWMLGMQAYQYVNFYLKQPLIYAPGAVILKDKMKDRFARQYGFSQVFAGNIQELLVYEFSALEPQWNKHVRTYEEKSLSAFENKCGIKAITLSEDDRKSFDKAAVNAREKLAGKEYPQELMNDIQHALAEYRSRK